MDTNCRPIGKAAPVQVLVISTSEIIRSALCLLIQSRAGMKVVGDLDTSEAALRGVRVQPDIWLVEAEHGMEGNSELLRSVVELARDAGIVVIMGRLQADAYCALVRLGVMGVVTRADSAENLFRAIERVHRGGVWLDRPVMQGLLSSITTRGASPRAPADYLTTREREIVQLVGEALSNRQIAGRLFVAETTVRHHLTSIFAKLGVSSRLELVKWAYGNGLASSHSIPRAPRTSLQSPV